MRKGELIKEDVKTLKPGDRAFDTLTKQFFTVKEIDDEVIHGRLINAGPCKVQKDSVIHELRIKDVITNEEFTLAPDQQAYVYKSGKGGNCLFFTRMNHLLEEEQAIVFAKNIDMQGVVNYIHPVADAYGQYVAGQKEVKEPAKSFEDWFFDVSI